MKMSVEFMDDKERFWTFGDNPESDMHSWLIRNGMLIIKQYAKGGTRVEVPLVNVRVIDIDTEGT